MILPLWDGWLIHWGRVMQICVGKLTNIGSDNGLSPGRRQAIIWTNAGILLIGPLGTNFSEFLIVIHTYSFSKMHLKMSSGKWSLFCLGLKLSSRLIFIMGIPIMTRLNLYIKITSLYWDGHQEIFGRESIHYTLRIFPPAIDIIPTLLAVVYSNGKYTN